MGIDSNWQPDLVWDMRNKCMLCNKQASYKATTFLKEEFNVCNDHAMHLTSLRGVREFTSITLEPIDRVTQFVKG